MVAHTVIPFVGGHLAKRFASEPEKYELPPWAFLVMLANFFVLLIPLTWVHYTLGSLLPSLAMVEDPNPPAYEPLASNDDVETAGTAPSAQNKNTGPALPGADGKPITSSIRGTHRVLQSIGGFRARFRGIMPAIAAGFITACVNGIFTKSFGLPPYLRIGGLFASFALVQLNTAWVHIIMTPPNPLPFWRRLPPLRRTFEATCFPVFANWAASTGAVALPLATAAMLGLKIWTPEKPDEIPHYDTSDSWKSLLVWLVSVGSHLLLVLPAQVGLTRVQASLLNPEEPTIVPFDSTFQGTVGPAVVDGKGYVTLKNAIKTFSRASWIRLLKLYVKTFFISLAAYIVVTIGFILQAVLLSAAAKPVGKN